MKWDLPPDHGLSPAVVAALVFRENQRPALTDAQFEALDSGIGRGESGLVVSPTSTGKTQIALWAIARNIEIRGNTVYLVTHRALAKQKFAEFKSVLLATFLESAASNLVLATGDNVQDADGNVPAEPLRAPLLVATYEKYLALLSASGVPSDMKSTLVVCDEIQLIGDTSRGQNVEVLLTLLKNAGWKQFLGLSAVMQTRDAADLAEWLGVRLITSQTREKHLRYECWTPQGIAAVSTERPEQIEEGLPMPKGVGASASAIVQHLLAQRPAPLPLIVFCTKRKQDTYDLAEELLATRGKPTSGQLSLAFDGLPETSANSLLAKALSHRIAIHNADLTDDERQVVEQHLLDGKLDVVFATPTLAAGVNFPFGAAVFESWTRYDFSRRVYVAIDGAEFHNMAGRVGRMGFGHGQGRVIFVATDSHEVRACRDYLNLGELPALVSRINPLRFNQLALQLVSSGLCRSRAELERLICNTLSGIREQASNATGFAAWPKSLTAAVDELCSETLLLETAAGSLVATPIGKAIAQSGLLPETGLFLLRYASSKAERMAALLPTSTTAGELTRLHFLLCVVCFSSPEFRPSGGKQPTRFLPWPLQRESLFNADPYRVDLPEPVWQADIVPINASKLSIDWIDGAELKSLESSLPQLSAGMLREMYRQLCWVLQGFSGILAVASDRRTPEELKPKFLRLTARDASYLGRIPRAIRRLSLRVSEGLPDDILWMPGLHFPGAMFRLSRSEMLALKANGLAKPQLVMLGTPDADKVRRLVFAKAKPSPQSKANWLRDACRDWKKEERKRFEGWHAKRAKRCVDVALVDAFYKTRGSEFEKVFEQILAYLNIRFKRLDDRTKTGAPDYLVSLESSPDLVFELKSKESDNLVDYNKAVEVLAASEVHGHKAASCVTLCHPGVDPSVPIAIAACGRLCVVESCDLGEALLRVCEGSLTQAQLYGWLASPGQAIASDLPFRDYASSSAYQAFRED